jgi:hypothetical protein
MHTVEPELRFTQSGLAVYEAPDTLAAWHLVDASAAWQAVGSPRKTA